MMSGLRVELFFDEEAGNWRQCGSASWPRLVLRWSV